MGPTARVYRRVCCAASEKRDHEYWKLFFLASTPDYASALGVRAELIMVGGVINDKDAPGGWGPRWGNRLVLQAAGTATHSCRLGPPPTPLTRLPRHLFFSFFSLEFYIIILFAPSK